MTFSILDLFDKKSIKQKNDGNWQTECPDCGLQGGRTQGFIIFPETNSCYCHSSGKHFNFLETYALQKKVIRCLDGKESGEKGNILKGEQFKETISLLKEEYGNNLADKILEELGIQKPKILLPRQGKLVSRFAQEIAEILKDKNILFYRPEIKDIVEIGKIKLHKNGEDIYNGFVPIKSSRFITLIEKYCTPGVMVEKKNGETGFVSKSMGFDIANVVIASHTLQQTLPQINRIFTVPIPIIYEGKLTFPKHGYDSRFGSWMPNNVPEIINPEMSVQEAKDCLWDVYHEFCFQTEQDYANAIAALITPYLRGIFKSFSTRTPIFFYIANRERAGKDYCAGVTGVVYEGVPQEDNPISNSENSRSSNTEELRKKLLAAMLSGRKRMHFSNNKGYINNAVIESVVTNSKYTDRILGKSEDVSFDNEMDFSMSGNVGVGFTPDFANRCRFIRLFLDIEDANARRFCRPDLHHYIKSNRGLILSALYALVRNWVECGCPDGTVPFASFPEWAKICGGVMEAAGYINPCNPDKETSPLAGDSETADMKQLFEICYEKYPEQIIKKSQIKDVAVETEDLFNYIDFDKRSDQTKFGNKISRFVGRVLSDIRLVLIDPTSRSSRQEFKFVKEKNEFGANKPVNLGNVGNVGNLADFNVRAIKNIYIESRGANVTKVANVATIQDTQKSDREQQFFESNDTKDIVCAHSKEEVLDYIKNNPNLQVKDLYEKFGVGTIKIKNELIRENKIKANDIGEIRYNE